MKLLRNSKTGVDFTLQHSTAERVFHLLIYGVSVIVSSPKIFDTQRAGLNRQGWHGHSLQSIQGDESHLPTAVVVQQVSYDLVAR
jgi:hypothetical protein